MGRAAPGGACGYVFRRRPFAPTNGPPKKNRGEKNRRRWARLQALATSAKLGVEGGTPRTFEGGRGGSKKKKLGPSICFFRCPEPRLGRISRCGHLPLLFQKIQALKKSVHNKNDCGNFRFHQRHPEGGNGPRRNRRAETQARGAFSGGIGLADKTHLAGISFPFSELDPPLPHPHDFPSIFLNRKGQTRRPRLSARPGRGTGPPPLVSRGVGGSSVGENNPLGRGLPKKGGQSEANLRGKGDRVDSRMLAEIFGRCETSGASRFEAHRGAKIGLERAGGRHGSPGIRGGTNQKKNPSRKHPAKLPRARGIASA